MSFCCDRLCASPHCPNCGKPVEAPLVSLRRYIKTLRDASAKRVETYKHRLEALNPLAPERARRHYEGAARRNEQLVRIYDAWLRELERLLKPARTK